MTRNAAAKNPLKSLPGVGVGAEQEQGRSRAGAAQAQLREWQRDQGREEGGHKYNVK